MNRRQWPITGRPGWYLEIGPVPDRKSPYVTLISPHGMHTLAQIPDLNNAVTLADCLDALSGRTYSTVEGNEEA